MATFDNGRPLPLYRTHLTYGTHLTHLTHLTHFRMRLRELCGIAATRGLSTEGHVAEGTECLDCVQTHSD